MIKMKYLKITPKDFQNQTELDDYAQRLYAVLEGIYQRDLTNGKRVENGRIEVIFEGDVDLPSLPEGLKGSYKPSISKAKFNLSSSKAPESGRQRLETLLNTLSSNRSVTWEGEGKSKTEVGRTAAVIRPRYFAGNPTYDMQYEVSGSPEETWLVHYLLPSMDTGVSVNRGELIFE